MKAENTLVLLDPGHGCNTPGKRKDDIREYAYARELARRIAAALERRGIESQNIVPEEVDVSLRERTRRANFIAARRRCILVSLHLDASGSGDTWTQPSGCSFRVAPNSSQDSIRLARTYTAKAKDMGLLGNRTVPPEGYWVQNLAICRDTTCPAILAENLFMTNKGDYDILTSEKGIEKIVSMHVDAITTYIEQTT